jgi:short-subunit dehydrogenase
MPNAIVTGATQGIGKAITEKFLSEGFSVAICARTQKDLDEVKTELEKKYPEAELLVFKADLADKQEVLAFAAFVNQHFSEIEVLVNNAGIFYPGNLADEEEGHLEQIMAVNLYSAYHLTRQLLPTMKMHRRGHIFNMCSVASLKAYPNGGSYSISKYALLGFSENLREELKSTGIKVTAIAPGATYSRSWQSTDLPEERFMKIEDVAAMVWASYSLSQAADVETIIMRPIRGDI